MLKKILRIFISMLVLLLLYLGILLGYGTYTDYQPTGAEQLSAERKAALNTIVDTSLTFSIWNLGYAGLGKESNFFFDHGNIYLSDGRMVRPAKDITEKNIAGIRQWLTENQTDFLLFQEVDYQSKRSYYINTFLSCADRLPGYSAYFAPNYKADYVPIPIFEPWQAYGKVYSGLASYSKYQPYHAERIQLPGSFEWPTRIFQLDRCVLLQKYKTNFGKDLIVMNVHNSAYDKTGELKAQQMAFLKELMVQFYEEGHFVVVGGDWNQCPPNFAFDAFMPGRTQGYTQINIPDDYLPGGWTYAYDEKTPTNRKIREVYEPGITFETLIDFYLLSPNLILKKVETDQLNFEYSDHQPVVLELQFMTRDSL